jgi:hypothetical protein
VAWVSADGGQPRLGPAGPVPRPSTPARRAGRCPGPGPRRPLVPGRTGGPGCGPGQVRAVSPAGIHRRSPSASFTRLDAAGQPVIAPPSSRHPAPVGNRLQSTRPPDRLNRHRCRQERWRWSRVRQARSTGPRSQSDVGCYAAGPVACSPGWCSPASRCGAHGTGGKADMPLAMMATIVQGDPALAAGTASPTVGVLVRIRTSDARRDAAVHSPGRAPAQEGR